MLIQPTLGEIKPTREEIPYWFKVTFLLNILGILKVRGDKDNLGLSRKHLVRLS